MKKMFEYKFKDSKIIVDLLKETTKKIGDTTSLMKVAKVTMKKIVDENFETEGAHSGDKWQEWSTAYKKQRIAMGKASGKILSLDGGLRKSIISESGKDYALVGTNKEYAAIHNFGGNSSLKHNATMPKREFMRVSDYDIVVLYAALYDRQLEILDEIKEKALRAGLG